MKTIVLTKEAFNLLLANLVELEEGRGEIIDVFFREPSKEVEDVKGVLNEYIRWLDATINKVVIVDTAENNFPNVIVGSEVIVEENGGSGTFSYKLVSPLKNKVDSHEISFLSPMGKAMLLKKVNDIFVVKAPGGDFEFKIKAVKIPTDSNSSVFAPITRSSKEESEDNKQKNIV